MSFRIDLGLEKMIINMFLQFAIFFVVVDNKQVHLQ